VSRVDAPTLWWSAGTFSTASSKYTSFVSKSIRSGRYPSLSSRVSRRFIVSSEIFGREGTTRANTAGEHKESTTVLQPGQHRLDGGIRQLEPSNANSRLSRAETRQLKPQATSRTDVRVGVVGRHTRPRGDNKKNVRRAALVVARSPGLDPRGSVRRSAVLRAAHRPVPPVSHFGQYAPKSWWDSTSGVPWTGQRSSVTGRAPPRPPRSRAGRRARSPRRGRAPARPSRRRRGRGPRRAPRRRRRRSR